MTSAFSPYPLPSSYPLCFIFYTPGWLWCLGWARFIQKSPFPYAPYSVQERDTIALLLDDLFYRVRWLVVQYSGCNYTAQGSWSCFSNDTGWLSLRTHINITSNPPSCNQCPWGEALKQNYKNKTGKIEECKYNRSSVTVLRFIDKFSLLSFLNINRSICWVLSYGLNKSGHYCL